MSINKSEIFQKIQDIIFNELNFNQCIEISNESKLIELNLDSFQLMQLFVFLEESFNFEFGDESIIANDKFNCVGDISNFIYEKFQVFTDKEE